MLIRSPVVKVVAPELTMSWAPIQEMSRMQVKSFLLTMGAGIAVGALGAMMLPKNSDAYRMTKQAAKAIQSEAEKAVDAISSAM